MSNTPSAPGNDMVFTKPNIPDCWGAQPVVVSNTEKEPVPTKEVAG